MLAENFYSFCASPILIISKFLWPYNSNHLKMKGAETLSCNRDSETEILKEESRKDLQLN